MYSGSFHAVLTTACGLDGFVCLFVFGQMVGVQQQPLRYENSVLNFCSHQNVTQAVIGDRSGKPDPV